MTKVEVDEVLGLVSDVGTEVAAYDAVPCGVVLLVEFLLDEGGDVLLDVVLLESLGSAVDGILLHVLRHVSVLNHGLTVRHGGKSVWVSGVCERDGRQGECRAGAIGEMRKGSQPGS